MVFQRPSMFPHMTAYQNIAWGLKLRRWPRKQIPGRVREMLKLVHLEDMEDRRFSQLSGGQAQRVVIARALAPEPDILLLDEPLSALDAKLRDELKLEIAEIHRKTGCTTILVTHDQGEALTIADNVLLMDEGKIMQEGSPLDVYRRPANMFSANFIGTNNFLPCKVVEVGDEALVLLDETDVKLRVAGDFDGLQPGVDVWACVRADDIDVIDRDQALKYRNVVSVKVKRASLTGGTVILESLLTGQAIRIHVGGSRRFELLNSNGSDIICALGYISLIPRIAGNESHVRDEMEVLNN
jgi:ABC-type Fe3+/spermidine/putrescine transport system ATPase subunit